MSNSNDDATEHISQTSPTDVNIADISQALDSNATSLPTSATGIYKFTDLNGLPLFQITIATNI